ncbi:hypothetical protein [Proteus mirabilis]|nr:hypothetical protein [Proteus mirabilis]MDM3604708.1 hypothetical protein [Proteus mirabilis]MDO1711123.1 hypothetical protein [Proteus mirabilis]
MGSIIKSSVPDEVISVTPAFLASSRKFVEAQLPQKMKIGV